MLISSSNLAVPWVAAELRGLVGGCTRALVLNSSRPEVFRASDPARLAEAALRRAGVPEVFSLSEVNSQHADLRSCDCVCLTGDNPFVLLEFLRAEGVDDLLLDLAAAGRPVLAAGLAACVLGRTLAHLPALGPCLAGAGCRDRGGLGLLPFSLLPSANRWRSARRDFPVNLARCEARHGRILTLDDDQALVMVDGEGRLIRPRPAS